MKSRSSQVVLVFFVIGLVILFLTMVGVGVKDIVKFEPAILMLRQSIGIYIATVAALMILLRALNETTLGEMLALLVALFGGLTLLTADWPAVVPLGLVIVGYVVIEVIRVFKPANGSSADQNTDEQ